MKEIHLGSCQAAFKAPGGQWQKQVTVGFPSLTAGVQRGACSLESPAEGTTLVVMMGTRETSD